MSCEHCTHCTERARNTQEAANLHPLGTHLIHPEHGHVVYWRNDVDRDGTPGRGHYVYRAERNLFYVWGDDFEIATIDFDLPASLTASLVADGEADTQLAAACAARRPFRRGQRITVTYANLYDVLRLVYWVRDMGESRTARSAAAKVAKQITAALA
ncbi:MAG TPA: hypothetical protein VFC19_49170 [Candidatus Limnocylindrales bacterium]|nr:hypothetical protein [Candidatus Limnocylindrales bacterium]